MKKTLIAIPCMDQVPAQFCQSLATLEKTGPTVVAFQVSSLIYTARNNLALMALEQEADYILWLDSDMVFPSGTLRHMIAEIEKQGEDVILTGAYFRRNPPFSPVLYDKLEIDPEKGATWAETTTIPDEMFEVEGCGFGCVLVPTAAVADVSAKYKDLFGPILGTGEDLSFCWRARQCGWKILCDPRIELGHVGHHIITRQYWKDFQAFKAGGTDNG